MGFLNPKFAYNVKATDYDPKITWKRVPCVPNLQYSTPWTSFDHYLASPCLTISSTFL